MSLKNELEEIMDTQDKGIEIIEAALWKSMEAICPQDITRQTSAYPGVEKLTDIDHCDGSYIYVNGCPDRAECDHIADLIQSNRNWYGVKEA